MCSGILATTRCCFDFRERGPIRVRQLSPHLSAQLCLQNLCCGLTRRLLAAGADKRLWKSQYGFRKSRGTQDALHCARRAVERAVAERGGVLHIMALDWAKAFDSICLESMVAALRRLGLTEHVLGVIAAIYSSREFCVRDCGSPELRIQESPRAVYSHPSYL